MAERVRRALVGEPRHEEVDEPAARGRVEEEGQVEHRLAHRAAPLDQHVLPRLAIFRRQALERLAAARRQVVARALILLELALADGVLAPRRPEQLEQRLGQLLVARVLLRYLDQLAVAPRLAHVKRNQPVDQRPHDLRVDHARIAQVTTRLVERALLVALRLLWLRLPHHRLEARFSGRAARSLGPARLRSPGGGFARAVGDSKLAVGVDLRVRDRLSRLPAANYLLDCLGRLL